MKTMFRIGPEQHTEEWYAMRKRCVTSSDAAVLMECAYSKSDTPLKRWQQKMGLVPEQEKTAAMQRGTDLEPHARMWCESHYGVALPAMTAIHPEIRGFMTSLDGIHHETGRVIEIKCGDAACRQAADGIIAPYYFAQCQWHLLVTGASEIQFVPFDGFEPVRNREGNFAILGIQREEPYIEELRNRALAFLECIEKNTPPGELALTVECPPEHVPTMEMYIQLDSIRKEADEKMKDFRQVLIEQGDDGDFTLTHGGIPRIKFKRTKGGKKIDWQAICSELKPSEALLRKHTKETIGHYVLSICKEKE